MAYYYSAVSVLVFYLRSGEYFLSKSLTMLWFAWQWSLSAQTGFLSHETKPHPKDTTAVFQPLNGHLVHMTRPELIHSKPHSKHVSCGSQGLCTDCFTLIVLCCLLRQMQLTPPLPSQSWSAPRKAFQWQSPRGMKGQLKVLTLRIVFWAVSHPLQWTGAFLLPRCMSRVGLVAQYSHAPHKTPGSQFCKARHYFITISFLKQLLKEKE